MATSFDSQVPTDLGVLLGANISLYAYGPAANGVGDDSAILQQAINAVSAQGGGDLKIPKGTYRLNNQVTVPTGVRLYGSGKSTQLLRGADLPDGHALLKITGSNVALAHFMIDGAVTTSAQLTYAAVLGGTIGGEPMDDELTKNSSIRLAPGISDIVIDDVTITHTGGYAIVADAVTDRISNVLIQKCQFVNNRPHLFGDTGDIDYGSWTGGIFFKGSGGTGHNCQNVSVVDCLFDRMLGNAVWSHLNAFTELHQNFVWSNNVFKDCGLDGVQMGGIDGFQVSGNSFHRIGYVHYTDTDTSVPRYYSLTQGARFAVAIDHSGKGRGDITGNSVHTCNGGAIDTDGLLDGSVTNNTLVNPDVGSVEATRDALASWGPKASAGNYGRGVNLGQTYFSGAASRLLITDNTIINFNGGNTLAAARNVLFSNNAIHQGALADGASVEYSPLVIFNTGVGADNRATQNLVENNMFVFSGGATKFCICELDTVFGTTTAFTSSEQNVISNNKIHGTNAGEFKKSALSGSLCGIYLSTNSASATAQSRTVISREGWDTTASLKIYKDIAGTSTQLAQLGDSKAGLNVSVGGAAGTGMFLTGSKTDAAVSDSIFTGHLIGNAFLMMKDADDLASDYDDVNADLFDDTWAGLRFKNGVWEQTVTTSTGARVWTNFGSGAGGSDKHVQFNDGGVLGGVANFTFDKTLQQVTLTGLTGTASLVTATSFIQSAEGFYTPSGSTTAIQAPSGTIKALYG